MTKFFKAKGTEIRRVAKCDDNGKPIEVIAIIGQVKELLAHEVIFSDNTIGNIEKWLVLDADGETFDEFDSLESAKKFCL